MSQTFQARVDAIDQEMLAPLVRQALQSPEAEVVEWRYVPLGEGGAKASWAVCASPDRHVYRMRWSRGHWCQWQDKIPHFWRDKIPQHKCSVRRYVI
jgi:hypothetical protein